MNAKHVLALILAGITIAGFAANEPIKRKRTGKATGGFLETVNTGLVIQVVNNQTICSQDVFDKALETIKGDLHFPFVTTAKSLIGARDPNASARVVVVAKDNAPVLLCAPEDGWCEFNVKPLLSDNPNNYTLKTRFEKELLRALGFALGCGNSSVQPCVMCEINSLKSLDAASRKMGPDAESKVKVVALSRGSQFRKYVSYRRACQEGWAPKPTNDVQKVIWDEVHTIPKTPIKIEP